MTGLTSSGGVQVRAGLYDFLGCKPCGDVANAAALVEGACTSVFGADGTAAACAAAGAAVPDTDARAIANVTGVPLQPQTSPGNDSGVSVPLLGGPPTVRGGAVDTLGAGAPAPAPAPAPMPAPADEAATAPEAGVDLLHTGVCSSLDQRCGHANSCMPCACAGGVVAGAPRAWRRCVCDSLKPVTIQIRMS